MTPQTKKTLIDSGILVALLTAGLAFLTWVARTGAQTIDSRYTHEVAYEKDRLADSLNYRADLKEIREKLVHLDSDFHVPPVKGRAR